MNNIGAKQHEPTRGQTPTAPIPQDSRPTCRQHRGREAAVNQPGKMMTVARGVLDGRRAGLPAEAVEAVHLALEVAGVEARRPLRPAARAGHVHPVLLVRDPAVAALHADREAEAEALEGGTP